MVSGALERRRYYVRRRGEISVPFLMNVAALLIFGLIILFSASYVLGYYKRNNPYAYIRPQFILGVVGFAFMLLISRMDYHTIEALTGVGYIGAIVLMCIALACEPLNACRRWIRFDWLPFTIQPGEAAKFAAMLVVASIYQYYHKRLRDIRFAVFLPLILVAPLLLLFRLQSHNSGLLITAAIVFVMLLAGGARVIHLALLGLLGGGGLLVFLLRRGGYTAERFDTYSLSLDWNVLHYQNKQSILAVASGGLTGVGITNGKQKQLWIPEVENDFIFSVVCEELGFVGAAICIGLFAALVIQGLMIAVNAPDRFGCLLAVGITAQIAIQVVLNLLVVLALIPNTGISLPFFSDGGTSLLMLLGEMGVMLSISRESNYQRELAAKQQPEKRG